MTDIVTDKWNNFNRNVQNYIIDEIKTSKIEFSLAGLYFGEDIGDSDIASPYDYYLRNVIIHDIMDPVIRSSGGLFKDIRCYGDSVTTDFLEIDMTAFPSLTVRDIDGNTDTLSFDNPENYNETSVPNSSEFDDFFLETVGYDFVINSKLFGKLELYRDYLFDNINGIHADDVIFFLENNGFEMDESEQNKIHKWMRDCITEFYNVFKHICEVYDNDYMPYVYNDNLIYNTLPEAFDYSNPDITIDLDTLDLVGVKLDI